VDEKGKEKLKGYIIIVYVITLTVGPIMTWSGSSIEGGKVERP
jgi:hypothetical protein